MAAPYSDEAFRLLLDANGFLKAPSYDPPTGFSWFTVFAQRTDAAIELPLWQRHATQFFSTRLGLTVAKKQEHETYGPPVRDVARIVVAPNDAPPATRFCFGRPREDSDIDAAERADIRAGSPGLGLLARRCPYVWLIASEGDPAAPHTDRAALLLSAIVASILLGPILSPDGEDLFGVRTARARLEKLGAA